MTKTKSTLVYTQPVYIHILILVSKTVVAGSANDKRVVYIHIIYRYYL